MLQNTTQAPSATPVAQPSVPQRSMPIQSSTVYNGLSANSPATAQTPNTLLSMSRGGNVPSTAAPLQLSPLVNGPTHWSTSGQQQQPHHPQLKQRLSDAEMWLASASVETAGPTGTKAQPNQGLLTTVNPFAETASQIDALSNAWTHDLQANLPPSTSSQGNTSWSSSPWRQGSTRPTNDDDFASFFASRQLSPPPRPPVAKKDSNPFKSSDQDQVFWV